MITLFIRTTSRLGAVMLLMLLSLSVHAQNVAIKGDVITVDKKPYAKLAKGGSMLMKDYTLLTLDDKEVMKAKGNITALPNNETFIYYMMTFQPGGETAEMSKTGLNFAQQLAEALVKNEVMRDGQPNPDGIKRFREAYSEKLSAKYAAETEKQNNTKPLEYKTVDRSRSNQAGISYNKRTKRTEIVQGDKVIGYLNPVSNESGRSNWAIVLPDGLSIAEVTIEAWMADSPGARDITYKMLVKKDNKYHNRSAVGGVAAAQQDAIQYLVLGGYL
ncbi:hypothetical protein [Hymenobacter sublimis]|uniref:Uncharacterized protein n=1 Tax=Hymenobacter sublimis TaxID=2933777 RepID=A0ABY4J9X0_9BACT|nr:hypothetical protein [Hymenobacter sublimis]UPL49612.1 hypothetical protein MWH26_01570 [Hymenobacter sublimis]